jgi:uncharacterized protein
MNGCPPNVVRTIAESANYAYGTSKDAVWVHLYGASECTASVGATTVKLTQETDYPWDGKVRINVATKLEQPAEFALMLRVPEWARNATVKVNGHLGPATTPGTYAEVRRAWSAGDVVEIDMPTPVRVIEANPYVEEARNQIAVMRGPVVYCLESADLPNDVRLLDVRLPRNAELTSRWDKDLLGGVTVVEGSAAAASQGEWAGKLYRDLNDTPAKPIDLRLIPYFAWANRGDSEMSVWLPLGG